MFPLLFLGPLCSPSMLTMCSWESQTWSVNFCLIVNWIIDGFDYIIRMSFDQKELLNCLYWHNLDEEFWIVSPTMKSWLFFYQKIEIERLLPASCLFDKLVTMSSRPVLKLHITYIATSSSCIKKKMELLNNHTSVMGTPLEKAPGFWKSMVNIICA